MMSWFNKLMAKWGLAEDKSGLWHMWQGNSSTCSMFATAHCAQALGIHVTRNDVFRLFDVANASDGNPDDQKTFVEDAMQAAVDEGWFSSFEPCGKIESIRFPCVLATEWLSGMEYVESDGRMSATGNLIGYHAMMLKKKTEKYYVVHNSVGTVWGDGGDGYILENDLRMLLKKQARIVIPNA